MWFFGRHKHLSDDRLSEYLDGRLPAGELARVDRAVAQCADCREELESLRETRSLLQSLPQFELPRSFVFSEAPAVSPARSAEPGRRVAFRMPGWAYAGAAAVAGVAAVLIVVAAGSDLWFSGAADEPSETMAMSAPAPQPALASPEMAAVQALPEPTAVPAAAASGIAMAQPESASSSPASEPASSGAQVFTAESMAAAPAEVQRSAEVGPVGEQAPEPAAVAEVPTPTPAPMAMMEAEMAVAGEAMAEPESVVPAPTAIPDAQAAAAASAEEPARAPAPQVLAVTPTPAVAAAVPAGLEATTAPVPLAEPTPTATHILKAQATALPQPTAMPEVAANEGEPGPTPEVPSPVLGGPAADETPAPTTVPSQAAMGATATGRAGPIATLAPSPTATVVMPEQEMVLAPTPEPTAIVPALQPTVVSTEEPGPQPSEQQTLPTAGLEPVRNDISSLEEETESREERPDLASAASAAAAARAPPAPTPEKSGPAPTAGLEAREGGAAQPDQFRGIDAAESSEPRETGIGLTWVLVGIAVVVLLMLLALGRRALFRRNSSE